MVTFQMIFFTTAATTVASGVAATAIVMFGDTASNAGQRAVAIRLAHIAVIGATALMALVSSRPG